MPKPIARLGDMTAHGGIIVTGNPTVLVGNKPVASLGDMHVCPMVTVLVPHIGGPIVGPGVINALVGKRPAAQVSDTAVCIGPPDTIVTGDVSVLVGK